MLYDKEIDYNYVTLDNNSRVHSFSSQTKECHAINILSPDRKVTHILHRVYGSQKHQFHNG
jgi:hypothetical protein